MEFDSFIVHVKANLGKKNPDAQQLMAPFKIGDRNEILRSNPNPRLGAVMILIYNKDQQAHITLIERPVYEGVHSGQIAFPGGAKDAADLSMKETALRELEEEVGIRPELVDVLGEISPVYIPPSKFLVSPFVGVLNSTPIFKKDDFEVKEVIELPVSLLFDDTIIKHGKVPIAGNSTMKLSAPYFDIYGHKVWGATAIMLSEFKAMMK